MYLTVVTESRAKAIGDGLTYFSKEPVSPGSLVRIPLRSGFSYGIVVDVSQKKPAVSFAMKEIDRVVGQLLPDALLALAKWMSEDTLCSLREALSVMLPPPPWRTLLPEMRKEYRLRKATEGRGSKRALVIDALGSGQWKSFDDLFAETGVSETVIAALVKKGILETREVMQEQSRPQAKEKTVRAAHAPSLLYYDGGKEKTDLFLREIRSQQKKGTILVLFPQEYQAHAAAAVIDAAFGNANVHRFTGRVGKTETMKLFQALAGRERCIIVGTRAALFLPVHDLSLIILDREHDWSWKNEKTPRYHGRPVATKLAELHGASLLLASRTPSMESWKENLEGASLQFSKTPAVQKGHITLRDLRDVHFGTSYPFSPTLVEMTNACLAAGKKSLFYVNTRGFARSLICLECSSFLSLQKHGHALRVHRDPLSRPFLVDHTTGEVDDVPETCPTCGSKNLKELGAGTQRVEQLAGKFFPDANILRFDRDASPHSARDAHRASILIGTQSVLRFSQHPDVTFACGVVADTGFSLPHLRAGEHAMQLLGELRDVAARGGEVLLQTYRPDSPEMQALASGDFETYAKEELKARKAHGMPPYCEQITLLFDGPHAETDARSFLKDLERALASSGKAEDVAGHVIAPSLFEPSRVHLHLFGKNPRHVLRVMKVPATRIDAYPLSRI